MSRPRSRDHLSSLVNDAANTSADLVNHAERLEALASELREMAKRLDEIGA